MPVEMCWLIKVATDIQNLARRNHHTSTSRRHIRYQDARDLKAIVYTEFNIEETHNIILSIWF
jgi:pyridoxine 5-phosphate synthase